MKRGWIIPGSMIVLLCGCSQQDQQYPEYFQPIVQRLEASMETEVPVMDDNWDKGVDYYFDRYADRMYTCSVHNVEYEFNLEDELEASREWHWNTAGIFSGDEEDMVYVCLNDRTVMYQDDLPDSPQLLLIEFSTEKPKEYQVWSYDVEPMYAFGWDVVCYRLQNCIYIAGERELAAINLDTKEFYQCDAEYAYAEEYIKGKFGEEPYHIFYFRAILEQDDVVVYSAEVDESFDELSPIGMLYIACKDHKPIANMYVDLTNDDITNSILVEMLE